MNKNTVKITGLAVVAAFALTSVASAGLITYVDAAVANTTLADGTAYTPIDPYVSTDDLWSNRGVGNSGTAYTANDNNANPGEDAPELRTTITGLAAGSYNLYAYLWAAGTNGNEDWDLAAGLTSGSLTDFKPSTGNVTDISGVTVASYFTDSGVMVAESNRELYQADLGTAVADGAGSIAIYIDDVTGNDDRSWFDGVGYEAIPEPATLSMLAVFGGGLLFIRRRLMI